MKKEKIRFYTNKIFEKYPRITDCKIKSNKKISKEKNKTEYKK